MGKEADGLSYCCFWFLLCCTVWLQWKARSGRIHKGNSSAGALCLPQDWPFRWSWVGLRVCFPFDLNNREQPHSVKRNILSRIVLYIGCSFPTKIDKLILVSLLGCRGFPFWLHDVPGIVFRTDNEPFKVLQSSHVMTVGPSQVNLLKWFPSHDFFWQFYMQTFTTKIVSLMKLEGLYASQGGPIILSQVMYSVTFIMFELG